MAPSCSAGPGWAYATDSEESENEKNGKGEGGEGDPTTADMEIESGISGMNEDQDMEMTNTTTNANDEPTPSPAKKKTPTSTKTKAKAKPKAIKPAPIPKEPKPKKPRPSRAKPKVPPIVPTVAGEAQGKTQAGGHSPKKAATTAMDTSVPDITVTPSRPPKESTSSSSLPLPLPSTLSRKLLSSQSTYHSTKSVTPPASTSASAAALTSVPLSRGLNRHYPLSGAGGGKDKKEGTQHHVIRKEDGDPLLRKDIQYDLLDLIFSSSIKAFTIPRLVPPSPIPLDPQSPTAEKLTFYQLYAYTISSSPRVTRQIKECLLDLSPGELPKAVRGPSLIGLIDGIPKKKSQTQRERDKKEERERAMLAMKEEEGSQGGDELEEKGEGEGGDGVNGEGENYDGLKEAYLKMCFLINFSRINTTHAFYPDMKTLGRHYHCIPSLQKTLCTRKSLQDAPRLKNGMRAVKLEGEEDGVPDTLELIASYIDSKRPSTTICNLIFALSNSPESVHSEFPQIKAAGTDFLACLTDVDITSEERARMFLAVVYHYLESDDPVLNPFGIPLPSGQENEKQNLFQLNKLSDEDYTALGENVDTEEELNWADEEKTTRLQHIQVLKAKLMTDKTGDSSRAASANPDESPPAPIRRGKGKQKSDAATPPPLQASVPAKKRKRPMEIYADDPSDAPTMAKGSDDVFTIKTDTNPATDLKRTERHASRMNWNDNLVGSLDRRWVSMVDVSGVNEELLERLIAQTESEIGPPPEREPDIRWDHFKPLYPGGDSINLTDDTKIVSTQKPRSEYMDQEQHPNMRQQMETQNMSAEVMPADQSPPIRRGGLAALLN